MGSRLNTFSALILSVISGRFESFLRAFSYSGDMRARIARFTVIGVRIGMVKVVKKREK